MWALLLACSLSVKRGSSAPTVPGEASLSLVLAKTGGCETQGWPFRGCKEPSSDTDTDKGRERRDGCCRAAVALSDKAGEGQQKKLRLSTNTGRAQALCSVPAHG